MILKLFLLMFSACAFSEMQKGKLKVSIYYETYCPCSSSLLSKQVYPAYKQLSEHLELDFVPFGQTKEYMENGVKVFKCKHGEQECYANRIHACAIAENIEQLALVTFIKCIVGGAYSDVELTQCAIEAAMSWDSIKHCAHSPNSDYILSVFGERTRTAALEHTPAIIFNETFNKTLDEKARHGFMATVCDLLKDLEVKNCVNVHLEQIRH